MPLEKALITNSDTQDQIEVLFNPEEYTAQQGQQLRPDGRSRPALPSFSSSSTATCKPWRWNSWSIPYETHQSAGRTIARAGQDVRDLTDKIRGLLDINNDTHAPPILVFAWGSLSFICVLARCSQKFIRFSQDGTPVRAKLQVTFNEFTNADTEAKEIKRQTTDYSKTYVVLQGETLSGIAGKLYRNAELWLPIALRNQIANPRDLVMGSKLLIPRSALPRSANRGGHHLDCVASTIRSGLPPADQRTGYPGCLSVFHHQRAIPAGPLCQRSRGSGLGQRQSALAAEITSRGWASARFPVRFSLPVPRFPARHPMACSISTTR